MSICRPQHQHLTEESRRQCEDGRAGWWGCSLSRPKEPVNGHFFHVTEEEARLCDESRGVYHWRSVMEA